MKHFTYEQAESKVLTDLDMDLEAGDAYVERDEIVGYFNDAIADAASEINRLGKEEDYFLTNVFLELEEGEDSYELPDDIYARDIRRIVYQNGTDIYPVKRFRGPKKFEAIALARELDVGADDYRYDLEMGSDRSQAKIVLIPPSRETRNDVMELWYIREPRVIPLVADGNEEDTLATIIDIPEFIQFIFAFVKFEIIEKSREPSDDYAAKLAAWRQKMVDTLSGYQDDDTIIKPDLSAYREHN